MTIALKPLAIGDTLNISLHTRDHAHAMDSKIAMFTLDLVDQSVVLAEEWDELEPSMRDNIYSSAN